MKLYDQTAYNTLEDEYIRKGGDITVIDEGSLLNGLTIMYGDGLKTAVIKEKFLNEWSSAYTITLYNKMPKKYEKELDKYNGNL